MKNILPKIQKFTEYLKTNRGYKDKTISEYYHNLRAFFKYVRVKFNKDIYSVELIHIDQYGKYLAEQPVGNTSRYYDEGRTLSNRTIQIRLNAIKQFYKRLERNKEETLVDYTRIEAPRSEEVEVDFLTEEELQKFFDIAEKEKRPDTRARNVLLLHTLYYTGGRVSEVVQLTVSGIESGEDQIQIIGKGGKIRPLFLNEKIRKMFSDYIYYRRNLDKMRIQPNKIVYSDAVFISHSDNSYGKPLSKQSISEIIKLYRKKTGIKKRITTHSFRHTFATHLLKKGTNIRVLQQLLGHKYITTTQRYTHIVNSEMLEATKSLL